MAKVVFTAHLREVAPQGVLDVAGDTVASALDAVWSRYPRARSYVLDDQGRLRRHIAIFLDGRLLKSTLDTRLRPESEIYVMQALSGG